MTGEKLVWRSGKTEHSMLCPRRNKQNAKTRDQQPILAEAALHEIGDANRSLASDRPESTMTPESGVATNFFRNIPLVRLLQQTKSSRGVDPGLAQHMCFAKSTG
jgi:hypothetical protein